MPGDGFETFRTRPKVLAIHLELLQYPILSDQIRERMREKLFSSGIVDVAAFQHEVREKAIRSQKRERMDDPLSQENEEMWNRRLSHISNILTEFYFAINFAHLDFLRIIEDTLAKKRAADHNVYLSINPEIAPWKMLFAQAKQIEGSSSKRQHAMRHHQREIIVVLTKGMLSDQLDFVAIAKNNFRIGDLESIYRRRIGRGKIGGKAGGMMLAKAILHQPEPDDPVDFREMVSIPDSYFLGSDVLYEFFEANNLGDTVNLKYMPYEEMIEAYPRILQRFVDARIPEPYRDRLGGILEQVGSSPVIVRSSSLLEDNFGISFAGKYDSFFCPNQGTPEQNLTDLCAAVRKVYGSLLSPSALAYRRQMGLIDYDERMAVLIQQVEGQRFGDHFFPVIAGVGFSYNPFQWSPRIDRDAGFLRIVAGMGTRAVDRLANDYARMVALSHPMLRPVKSTAEVIQYSQKMMDVIDLASNTMGPLPVGEVIDQTFPFLKHIGSIDTGGELHPVLIRGPGTVKGDIIITHDGLLKNKRFVSVMRGMLAKLRRHYAKPVDIEFTVDLRPGPDLDFRIVLLQCRQQSRRLEQAAIAIPEDISERDILLVSRRMVSSGRIRGVRYVVYVDPEDYKILSDNARKVRISRVIGKLNTQINDGPFILVGPGRWGSSNMDLGVPVSYAEIFNARALVEIALPHGDAAPEASYGTHFFQDLVESNIYPIPVYPGEKGAFFNFHFFRSSPNVISRFVSAAADVERFLKVVDIKQVSGGKVLELIMNAPEEKAIAFLARPGAVDERPAGRKITGEYKIKISGG